MPPKGNPRGSGSGSKKRKSKEGTEEPRLAKEVEEDEENGDLFFIDTEATAPAITTHEQDEDDGRIQGSDDEDEDIQGQGRGQKKGRVTSKGKKTSRAGGDDDNDQKEEVAGGEHDEAEAALERMLFGTQDIGSLFRGSEAPVEEDDDGEQQQEEEQERRAWQDEDDEDVRVDIAGKDRLRKLRHTPDEEDISGAAYQERLRARFQQSNKNALSWAALPDDKGKKKKKKKRPRDGTGDSSGDDDEGDDYDDDELELFKSSAPLVAGSSKTHKRLQPGILEIFRCRDANLEEPSKAVIQAVQFNPSCSGLLLTAGLDKTLRLFQVDGTKNEKAAGVFFPDLPIQSAAFIGDAFQEVVVSGRRPFFYWYDTTTGSAHRVSKLMGREEKSLEKFTASPDGKWLAFTGKDGYIILVSAKSKQWAGEYKMNGTARSICFTPDSSEIVASGGDAVVYRWDMRSQRCLSRFRNEGGTVTSSLAACGLGLSGYTAVGAESGVVNLYDNGDIMAEQQQQQQSIMETDVKPLKAIMNLTTAVDTLAFNHDGQLLAMASKWNRDALRMVHVPSRTVFSNWPTGQTPIRYPSAISFSPNSGLFAVGNDRGRVLLYRLRHFDSS